MDKEYTEEEMQEMEERIPEIALEAFREAYQKAWDSGRPFCVAKDDALWMIDKYGRKDFIKKIAPEVKLEIKKNK